MKFLCKVLAHYYLNREYQNYNYLKRKTNSNYSVTISLSSSAKLCREQLDLKNKTVSWLDTVKIKTKRTIDNAII